METNMAMHIRICEKRNLDTKEEILLLDEEAYTLLYVVHGGGKMVINNITFQLQPNAVVCIRPQSAAKIYATEGQLKIVYFQYDGGEADYLYALSMFANSGPVCNTRGKEILMCFQNIYDEAKQKQANRHYLVAEVMHIFSCFTKQAVAKESLKYQNRYLQRAIDIIQFSPSTPISVNELAKRVNVDRSYLYRIFEKETSMSPREYIIDYKLKLSAEKLKKKNENIQSVFEKLGFSSYYLAEKKFKEKFGVTPREYQKQEGLWGERGTIKNH